MKQHREQHAEAMRQHAKSVTPNLRAHLLHALLAELTGRFSLLIFVSDAIRRAMEELRRTLAENLPKGSGELSVFLA